MSGRYTPPGGAQQARPPSSGPAALAMRMSLAVTELVGAWADSRTAIITAGARFITDEVDVAMADRLLGALDALTAIDAEARAYVARLQGNGI